METEVVKEKKSKFKVGDRVLISSQVTHLPNEIEAVVTKVENNPFAGIVITAESKDKTIYFEKEFLFKKINN